MKLGRLLILVLGLAAVAYAVKYALQDTAARDSATAASRPKRQLDNVREKARELEREQQKAADDVAAQSGAR